MTRTLNLFENLLALGRGYRDQGRLLDASRVFDSLAAFGELPAAFAEEVHADLAEIHLKRRRYRRARRHLTAAVTYNPDNARYHYLLAVACRADSCGDFERAGKHFRRSLELEPENVKCLGDYGLLLIRDGYNEQGLAYLRKAVDLAPENAEAAEKLIKGMHRAGLPDEARDAARSAMFQNPRSSRFRQLWRDSQFRMASRRQRSNRIAEQLPSAESAPCILPFLRLTQLTDESAIENGIRQDGPEPLPAPRHPKTARRHVQ